MFRRKRHSGSGEKMSVGVSRGIPGLEPGHTAPESPMTLGLGASLDLPSDLLTNSHCNKDQFHLGSSQRLVLSKLVRSNRSH